MVSHIRLILASTCVTLSLLSAATAQVVQNVSFDVAEDSTIVVYYDLAAESEKKPCRVKLEVSTNGGGSFISTRTTSGDVGDVFRSGGKTIFWDALSDMESLESERVVVKVIASEVTNVGEIASDIFIGSNSTKAHVDGWSLYGSGTQSLFKSQYYNGLKKSGLMKDQYGYGGGLKLITLPFIVDVNCFFLKYDVMNLSQNGVGIRHWGVNTSLAFSILPFFKYLIPLVGGGYQFSQLELDDQSVSKNKSILSSSNPFLLGGVNLAITPSFVVGAEYRQSFSLDKADKGDSRGWKQWLLYLGIHFGNPNY